eukprot:12894790-Prorocentrum_lima.AAC.1
MRIHKHGKSNSTCVLSANLSGPHPVAIGTKYVYLCVAVFNVGSINLPFVRGLPNKTADAIHSVLAELNSMAGKQVV